MAQLVELSTTSKFESHLGRKIFLFHSVEGLLEYKILAPSPCFSVSMGGENKYPNIGNVLNNILITFWISSN